jgi:hypothetical protein
MIECNSLSMRLHVKGNVMWISTNSGKAFTKVEGCAPCETPCVPDDAVEWVNFSLFSGVHFDRVALTENGDFILFKIAKDMFLAKACGLRLKSWYHYKSIDKLVSFAINQLINEVRNDE